MKLAQHLRFLRMGERCGVVFLASSRIFLAEGFFLCTSVQLTCFVLDSITNKQTHRHPNLLTCCSRVGQAVLVGCRLFVGYTFTIVRASYRAKFCQYVYLSVVAVSS